MKLRTLSSVVTAALLGTASLPSFAANVQSISHIAFAPDGTLFVADWKQAQIDAIKLPAAPKATGAEYNLRDFTAILDRVLGHGPHTLLDMKKRPNSDQVFVAVSVGKAQSPAIVEVMPDGKASLLNLKQVKATTISLKDAPDGDATFWGHTPERSFTVSDMQWHNGKLYVAGLSNQVFASTLRVIPYPFDGSQALTSVEMYHTAHNQIETRAPIRTMTFANINGTDTLIAAYVCTPLVAIPVSELKNGAHVTGKTIAELGYGNTPVNLLLFDSKDQAGKEVSYLLLTNVERGADQIPMASVITAVGKPGLSKPVAWGATAGVDVQPVPINGDVAIDNYGNDEFVALQRDLKSGDAQLVTLGTQFKIRLSNYVSEYDFPSYKYAPGFQQKYIKPIQDKMIMQEGYGAMLKPSPER